MDAHTMYIVWLAAFFVFSVLEGITTQLVSIWFVIGSAAAFVSSLCNVPIYLQVIIFIAVSLVALIVTRPLVKKKLEVKIEPTNADRCIGTTATVVEDIDNINGKGQVKVDGKIWSARSENNEIIQKDTLVTVKKIDGVKLIVEK